MTITVLKGSFTVCKVADLTQIDLAEAPVFFAATDEERSLVCPTERTPANTVARQDGWRGFRIRGELDFSLVGILAGLTAVLAAGGIGIFAVSTYNTDYLFTASSDFPRALSLLAAAGYRISEGEV